MAKSLLDFVKEARQNIEEITIDDFEEMVEDEPDLMILDIREESEFASGHIENSVLVPRGTLEGAADPHYKKRHPELCQARTRPIVVYCATGGRSAMAVATLQQMGFERVYNLMGGFELWEAEDNPVIKN
ncbi:MAG: rhodanese-like domain-containing protein [Gammaproteobacteria bacterium]|nr:rhodanese-like domain-containing protein [Gammaproteobacteria bacterium]